jgi:hypothetical protein
LCEVVSHRCELHYFRKYMQLALTHPIPEDTRRAFRRLKVMVAAGCYPPAQVERQTRELQGLLIRDDKDDWAIRRVWAVVGSPGASEV